MGEAKNRGSFEDRKKNALERNNQSCISNMNFPSIATNYQIIQQSRERLLQFTDSISKSLQDKNYFAALIMALTLPDICCSLEDENRRTKGKKYANWFTKYLGDQYKSRIGGQSTETVFLSGEECYALRCAYLHKGFNQIEDEVIVQNYIGVSSRIEFMAEMSSDKLKINGVLLLSLENFCQQIIDGIIKWLDDNKTNSIINERIKEIPVIHTKGFSPMPGVFVEG